jgi:hypothetical protein
MAQSLEYYAGHRRTGVDILWFKYFKTAESKTSPFLFFSRNRASVDYHDSPTLFGSTNAVSYNLKNGLGFTAVASFTNSGFMPKAGVQYYIGKKDIMFFGWLVAEIKRDGNLDLFGLFRYQPEINKSWKGFLQIELFPVFNPSSHILNITQRIRTGFRRNAWAGGLMADFNQTGKNTFVTSHNTGGFLRYEF